MTEPERPEDPGSATADAAGEPPAGAADAVEAPATADIFANLEAAATPDIGATVDDGVPAATVAPVETVATTTITPPPGPPPAAPVAVPVAVAVTAPVAPAPPPAAPARRGRSLAGTLARIVTFLFGILQALLILRIVLLLLNANQDNEIVAAILSITEPFVAPFRGMFQLDEVTGANGSILDVAAIVALVAWTLVETLIVSVLGLFRRRSRSR
jgi:uncharacterized protein YggT (Ycf19 family)